MVYDIIPTYLGSRLPYIPSTTRGPVFIAQVATQRFIDAVFTKKQFAQITLTLSDIWTDSSPGIFPKPPMAAPTEGTPNKPNSTST